MNRKKVVVCYVPGLDLRRISADATPTIAELIRRHSLIELSIIPSTDLTPILISGVYPHQSEIWQVSLKADRTRTIGQRLVDALPDIVTTTAQGVRQRFDPDFDLAAIPPRRRREFTLHRLSEIQRASRPEIMDEFNGYPTLLSLLETDTRYMLTLRFRALPGLIRDIPSDAIGFDFLQMHAFDLYQHWHIDDEAGMREALLRTDRFVADLCERCARTGHTLVLLSDHGQDPVERTIPLMQTLKRSGVPRDEYSYYCELGMARLWFHTDRARDTLKPLIEQLPDCSLLHYRDMHPYHVCFEDDAFGEYYVLAQPGTIFFPHDFYQPVANFYLAASGREQRIRMFNPVHRGNHGYLPHHPSEKGFLVVADDNVTPTRDTMSVIDFAPTMLTYFGADVPPHMTGENVLTASTR